MGSSTVCPTMAAKSGALHPEGGDSPVEEGMFWFRALVTSQRPASVLRNPKPPGTRLPEGPVQPPTVSPLVRLMICRVVVDGMPPPVCALKEHHEKASGRSAVPLLGPPQPTVAVATTADEFRPMTGANQCCLGVLPVTLTLTGALLSSGCAAVPSPSLAVIRACAVARMSPQLPREQSCATAIAAASAATWRRAFSA